MEKKRASRVFTWFYSLADYDTVFTKFVANKYYYCRGGKHCGLTYGALVSDVGRVPCVLPPDCGHVYEGFVSTSGLTTTQPTERQCGAVCQRSSAVFTAQFGE